MRPHRSRIERAAATALSHGRNSRRMVFDDRQPPTREPDTTRSAAMVIDTVVCLTLAKWETASGRFGGYLSSSFPACRESLERIKYPDLRFTHRNLTPAKGGDATLATSARRRLSWHSAGLHDRAAGIRSSGRAGTHDTDRSCCESSGRIDIPQHGVAGGRRARRGGAVRGLCPGDHGQAERGRAGDRRTPAPRLSCQAARRSDRRVCGPL